MGILDNDTVVVDAILKHNLSDRTIVSSFNPLRLRKIKSLNSNITTAQLWDENEAFSSFRWIYVSRPDLFHGNIDQFNYNMIWILILVLLLCHLFDCVYAIY